MEENTDDQPSRTPLWSASEGIAEEPAELASPNEEHTLPPSIEELKSMMLASGWCLHQINYLTQLYNTIDLQKFASLDRTQRAVDHQACAKATQCVAFNTDMKNYAVKHAATCSYPGPGSGCYTVRVPYERLINVIKAGHVPLVSIRCSPEHGLSFRIHRRRFRAKYASISHVWADGLGNPVDNALPSCQVKLLQSLLDYGMDDSHITHYLHLGFRKMLWMDTLCIPVQPEHLNLRRRCIDSMASIYAGSDRVFVLDKELMSVASGKRDIDLYRIACSVWMCRSWTLQEAILPRHCLFQFSNGIYNPLQDYRFGSRYQYRSPEPENHDASSDTFGVTPSDAFNARCAIETTVIDNFLQMRKQIRSVVELLENQTFSKNSERLEAFISTWNALAGRSTTKADDLYVVLGSCLNFKLRQFRKFNTPEETMQRIIFSFSELPFSLFFNYGERLNSDGHHFNRWLPTAVGRQLLLPGSTFILPHPKISKYSDQGTRLQLKLGPELALYLSNCAIPQLDQFTISTDQGVYEIYPSLAPTDTFQRNGFIATCVVMENFSTSAEGKLKGACFYVLSIQNPTQASTGGALIEMVYCCPLVIIALEGRPQSASDFPASKMNSKCTFWVKFGKYFSFLSDE